MTNKLMLKTLTVATVGAGLLAVGGLSSKPAEAAALNNGIGLTNPANTITFNEFSFSDGTQLNNQYVSRGVTFSNLFSTDFYSGRFPNANGTSAVNFNGPIFNPITIKFLQQQTAAAFSFVTNPGSSAFRSYLNGALVEAFNASTDISGNFYGFSNSLFDEIRISAGGTNGAALVDNLQYAYKPTAVPTPALLPGLIGLGVGVLRKRKAEAAKQTSEA